MSGIIKEAIEYIVQMKKPEVVNVDGVNYSEDRLHPVFYDPKAVPIEVSTLTSLVKYIKSNVDQLGDRMIVHVESPTRVVLFSKLDEHRTREYLVEVNARIPNFTYERYIAHEQFCVALQAKFLDDPESDRSKVLQFAGTVENGTVAQYSDDGISQKATVKTGIASKADMVVPNPVKLRPYRTFCEVQQPMSEFIFRMRSDCGVECALFEADGGAWKNVAMDNIKTHLEVELDDLNKFVVIS